jgi:hypothetical protein
MTRLFTFKGDIVVVVVVECSRDGEGLEKKDRETRWVGTCTGLNCM